MNIEGARRVIETSSPDTANQYLRFGWKLINQYNIPATAEEPPKVSFVLASIRTLEDTRQLVRESDWELVNKYLELGWRLIDRYVAASKELEVRDETLYFVLAWQHEESPGYPDAQLVDGEESADGPDTLEIDVDLPGDSPPELRTNF